jgi:hydrogenase expression/formation protein HypD
VPGRRGTLERARAAGADVRVVYSAGDVLNFARQEPHRHFVFAAVGFETTAPATAALVLSAKRERLSNLSVLASHKRVVPALHALLLQPDLRLSGIVLPGHVSIVIGADAYGDLALRHRLPMVIAGFEDWQLVEAVHRLLTQLVAGEHRIENLYPQAVSPQGNGAACEILDAVFAVSDATWRGLGEIADSGFALRAEFAQFDAARRLKLPSLPAHEHPSCRCGDIITGRAQPADCALFGHACTPVHPLGPCMVSSEGTCQAWFKYRRTAQTEFAT